MLKKRTACSSKSLAHIYLTASLLSPETAIDSHCGGNPRYVVTNPNGKTVWNRDSGYCAVDVKEADYEVE
jgi:hypothetical protein